MEHVLRLKSFHKKQQEVFDAFNKYKIICIMAGRQSGKSFFAKQLIVELLLDGKRCLYFTPEYRLSNLFLEEISEMLGPLVSKKNIKDSQLTTLTGGFLSFYTDSNAVKVRGNTMIDFIVIDEASFFTNLRSKLDADITPTQAAAPDGKLLLISTPLGYNDFSNYYLQGLEENEYIKSFKFTYKDNPYISEDFIEMKRKELPDRIFRQEYDAELLNLECIFGDVDACIKPLSTKPTVCYGIDVASLQDYAVIIGLDEDCNMTYFDRFQGNLKEVVRKGMLLDPNIPINIDRTGNGLGPFQELSSLRKNVNGYNFTNESKSNIMFMLMDAIDKKTISYNEITANELKAMEMTRTPTGNFKYQGKSGFHDDCVIALGLALELHKRLSYKSDRFYRPRTK